MTRIILKQYHTRVGAPMLAPGEYEIGAGIEREYAEYLVAMGYADGMTDAVEEESPSPLEGMTNAELRAFAESEGIAVPVRANKAELIAAIEAAATPEE